MRSDYQRAHFAAALDAELAAAEKSVRVIGSKVEPALRLAAELDIAPGTRAAREIGRSADGRPLRADLRPTAGARASRRVIVDDGTSAEALGAERIVRIEQAQLVAAAEAVERIRALLADPTAVLGPDAVADAAGIVLLPGALKADLLATLERAAKRPGAAELRAEIAATPERPARARDEVPERVAGTVWALAGRTRTVHQLLVRIYPEPLAVDSPRTASPRPNGPPAPRSGSSGRPRAATTSCARAPGVRCASAAHPARGVDRAGHRTGGATPH